MRERFIQLDSLRGLAAITVLLHHLSLIPATMPQPVIEAIHNNFSPFKLLFNGHEAVILFFMLSGFVLSLPVMADTKQVYSKYLVRRFFRIYVPYIASFFIGWLFLVLSPKINAAYVSEFMQETWVRDLNMLDIWQHIGAIFTIHTDTVNFVYWSLVQEMRISLIFPFVVLLLANTRWFYVVALGIVLTVIGAANLAFNIQVTDDNTSYIDTLYYLSFFLYGMLLAKYRKSLIAWFQRLSRPIKYGLLFASAICYNSSGYIFIVISKFGIAAPFTRNDPVIAIGALGFIIIALASEKASRILHLRLPVFMGQISYSLYLYHLVVIQSLIHSPITSYMPLSILLLLALILSLAATVLTWVLIEKPSMEVGRYLTRNKKRNSLVLLAKSSDVP